MPMLADLRFVTETTGLAALIGMSASASSWLRSSFPDPNSAKSAPAADLASAVTLTPQPQPPLTPHTASPTATRQSPCDPPLRPDQTTPPQPFRTYSCPHNRPADPALHTAAHPHPSGPRIRSVVTSTNSSTFDPCWTATAVISRCDLPRRSFSWASAPSLDPGLPRMVSSRAQT